MSLILAGERSGVGKTTVTLALLAGLQQAGLAVQSFKVGPDYIDPLFHTLATGRPCRNLDPVLTSEAYVQDCFHTHSQGVPYALIEGVMGLFDGSGGADFWGSTAHVARLLALPVVLVVDCSRLSTSVAAIVQGYRSLDPRLEVAGLFLNRVASDRHQDLLEQALDPLGIPILGQLRREDGVELPARHLGLVPPAELGEVSRYFERLGHLSRQHFNWEKLLPLLRTQPSQFSVRSSLQPFWGADLGTKGDKGDAKVRLGVARDPAFSFYYADNLDLLAILGADLVFWSPLQDEGLPAGLQGLYFGGGFPELFAQDLSQNHRLLRHLQGVIQGGMPCYAECGGLMYLSQGIIDFAGRPFPLVGILPTQAEMGQRLTLGYRQALTLQAGPLLPADTLVWGHEFHRSVLRTPPDSPLYRFQALSHSQPSNQTEGWRRYQLHGSYLHLHWGAHPERPARFLRHCTGFGGGGAAAD